VAAAGPGRIAHGCVEAQVVLPCRTPAAHRAAARQLARTVVWPVERVGPGWEQPARGARTRARQACLAGLARVGAAQARRAELRVHSRCHQCVQGCVRPKPAKHLPATSAGMQHATQDTGRTVADSCEARLEMSCSSAPRSSTAARPGVVLAWPTSEPERLDRQLRAGSAARVTDAARPQLAHRSAAGVWKARSAKGVRVKQLMGPSIGRPADAAAAPALTPGKSHVWNAEQH